MAARENCYICLEPISAPDSIVLNEDCRHPLHLACLEGMIDSGLVVCGYCKRPFDRPFEYAPPAPLAPASSQDLEALLARVAERRARPAWLWPLEDGGDFDAAALAAAAGAVDWGWSVAELASAVAAATADFGAAFGGYGLAAPPRAEPTRASYFDPVFDQESWEREAQVWRDLITTAEHIEGRAAASASLTTPLTGLRFGAGSSDWASPFFHCRVCADYALHSGRAPDRWKWRPRKEGRAGGGESWKWRPRGKARWGGGGDGAAAKWKWRPRGAGGGEEAAAGWRWRPRGRPG